MTTSATTLLEATTTSASLTTTITSRISVHLTSDLRGSCYHRTLIICLDLLPVLSPTIYMLIKWTVMNDPGNFADKWTDLVTDSFWLFPPSLIEPNSIPSRSIHYQLFIDFFRYLRLDLLMYMCVVNFWYHCEDNKIPPPPPPLNKYNIGPRGVSWWNMW